MKKDKDYIEIKNLLEKHGIEVGESYYFANTYKDNFISDAQFGFYYSKQHKKWALCCDVNGEYFVNIMFFNSVCELGQILKLLGKIEIE